MSYNYTWEGLPILAPFTIKSNQTVWTVEKLDKSINRSTHPSQRWDISFGVATNGDEQAAFKALTNGFSSKGTMVMPSLVGAKKAVAPASRPSSTQIKTNASHAAGTSTIHVKNTTAAACAVGLSTFIKFVGHTKVYAVTASQTFAGSATDVELKIFPSLREAVSADTTIKFYDDVNLHYYLDDTNIQGITYSNGLMTSISKVSLWEAI